MTHTTTTAALAALYGAGETLLEFWSHGTPVQPGSDAAADFAAAMARSAAQVRAISSPAPAGMYDRNDPKTFLRAAFAVLDQPAGQNAREPLAGDIRQAKAWIAQALEMLAAPAGINALAVLETKPEPEPEPPAEMLRVFYVCPDCENEWEEEWTSACDSECPKCGLENIEATRFCGIDETDPSDLAPV